MHFTYGYPYKILDSFIITNRLRYSTGIVFGWLRIHQDLKSSFLDKLVNHERFELSPDNWMKDLESPKRDSIIREYTARYTSLIKFLKMYAPALIGFNVFAWMYQWPIEMYLFFMLYISVDRIIRKLIYYCSWSLCLKRHHE